MCQDYAGVWGYFDLKKTGGHPICIGCGQCSMACPTESIVPRSEVAAVKAALADAQKRVVFAMSPAVRVAAGEAFGLPPGTNVEAGTIAALRKLGADFVVDTSFGADLTVVLEAEELVQKLQGGAKGPLMTSCCPAWVKFAEIFHPELLPSVSTVKSPIGLMGVTTKTWFAEQVKVVPGDLFNVAVTPCTAKKAEIRRKEMSVNGQRGFDAVLTVRELAAWLKAERVDLQQAGKGEFDSWMGRGSGAGLIFGNTGGVTEATLRTAYFLMEGKNPSEDFFKLTPLRGELAGVKQAAVVLGGRQVHVGVVQGTAEVRKLVEKDLLKGFDFVEVMACHGGCIGGGGTPRTTVPLSDEVRMARVAGLNAADAAAPKRLAHENPQVLSFGESSAGRAAKRNGLLYTTYTDCSRYLG